MNCCHHQPGQPIFIFIYASMIMFLASLLPATPVFIAMALSTRFSTLPRPFLQYRHSTHGARRQRRQFPSQYLCASPTRNSSQDEFTAESSSSSSSSANNNNGCIYLDYNGTTKTDKRVLEAMLPYFTEHWGNPSSGHFYGQEPKRAVAKARRSILSLFSPSRIPSIEEEDDDDCGDDGIVFTGCGTEADNLAIHLALEANRLRFLPSKNKDGNERTKGLPHIVTSNVEHPAISECLKSLEDDNRIMVTYVAVDKEGIVSAQAMIEAIVEKENDAGGGTTVLVTMMLANNESGSLQPVREVADYCRTKGILFHTDAAQAVGKVSLSMEKDGGKSSGGIGSNVDMATIVGHKFGAPKGVACLHIRPGCFDRKHLSVPKKYMLLGGGQENGRRGGTENVPYIVGMGVAADILMRKMPQGDLQWQQDAHWMKAMRYRLLKSLTEGLPEHVVRDNGPHRRFNRLPNTLSVGFRGVDSSQLLERIQHRVACSAGAACHSGDGKGKISSVLEAMEVPMEYAVGTLRLSVGPGTTEDEIDKASVIIIEEVKRQLTSL